MGKGGQGSQTTGSAEVQTYSWSEVKNHADKSDKWLVIDGQVYDITSWSRRHPGGGRVISHYAGQDATDAFRAFHSDLAAVKKYLKPIHMGSIQPDEQQTVSSIDEDFRNLSATADKMGLFKPSYLFYFLQVVHVLVLEVAGYLVMSHFGTGWIPWITSLICTATVQAQTGWLQHDFGHLSVFKKSKWDHFCHYVILGIVKGASPQWWNHMHFQHHAKPNVMDKDPDVRMDALFVIGKNMPVMVAQTKKKSMPYNWQQHYWFVIGPPLLFPVYFQYMLFRHIFTRKLWMDLFVVLLYFARFFYLYIPLLGWGILPYYFVLRCLESHWFTWVSQSNHLPMDIKADEEEPWLKLQMHATCNIERSFFNDWFTGHLNFQIEHHLFPMMPRHNLYKITPLVKSLCQKHGLDYQVKSLYEAFADIVRTLRHSGELWYSTYQQFHSP
ncbi:hypothetical protein ACOMHN_015663 [Nucella lapillus]